MPQTACHHHHCKPTAFMRHRYSRNSYGPLQRYRCKSCGRTFSGLPGFKKRHVDLGVISGALRSAAYGMPCTAVQTMIAPDKVIHSSTIYWWTAYYWALMDKYSRQLRPCTSYKWHCDEICFKIRKQARWLFAVMDGGTRFILSHDIAATKMGYKPLSLFAAARNLAGATSWVLITDGLQVFRPAARKAFWNRTGHRLVHVREIHLTNSCSHNNVHERSNGKINDRIKTARGFWKENPARILLTIVHHIFFRLHSDLEKMTPVGTTGIIIKGTDKQITFICNAAVHTA